MPRASEVRPGKWSSLRVLFDDGVYSVVSGDYENQHALGERWNGSEGVLGFPNQSGHPVWHVVPDFLAIPVLHGILGELARHPESDYRERAAGVFLEIERWELLTRHGQSPPAVALSTASDLHRT